MNQREGGMTSTKLFVNFINLKSRIRAYIDSISVIFFLIRRLLTGILSSYIKFTVTRLRVYVSVISV